MTQPAQPTLTQINAQKTNHYIEQIRQKAEEAIEDSYNALVRNVIYNKLPEDIFVNKFLPYFCGEKTLNETDDPIMALWIGIAGTPTLPVTIINAAGEPLYNVPALFSTNIINTLDPNSKSFKDIVNNYLIRRENMPMMANGFLAGALEEKSKSLINTKEDPETIAQWEMIFNRYGKGGAKITTKPADELDADDFDFS